MAEKLVHLIKGLGPGGAEQLLVNQARAIPGTTFDVSVAYLISWKDHLVEPLADAGWATVCLNSDRAWDLRWLRSFRSLASKHDVTVIHGHSPLPSSLARLVIRTLPPSRRPRSVYTEHNEWGRHKPLTRLLNRLTIGLEDHVIAVSDGVQDSMPPSVNAEVLLHGIDVDAVAAKRADRAAVRTELGIEDDEIVIGIVANFRREKAYDLLLEAASRTIEANPKIRFVSVGQGPLDDAIRAQHAELHLGDRFQLLGYREDATRIMSGFDVFTLASLHEGLPVALMEAMALGLPVAATAVGGIPAALADWPSIVVPPGSIEDLVEAYRNAADLVAQSAIAPKTTRFDMGGAATRLQAIYSAP